MPRDSLLDYFQQDSRPANETAVVWCRGYRIERWSYAQLRRIAVQFACELQSRGIAKGDRVLIGGENSGEWIAAFLGCMFAGAVAVPMDAIAEKSFAGRVVRQSGARVAVASRSLPASDLGIPSIALEDLSQVIAHHSTDSFATVKAKASDAVEIVFTSGTTAEPRGVVLTHANILANLAPIEAGFARYRRYERWLHPLRVLDLLPLSHVFGQILGIFIPQILGATAVFSDSLNPAEITRTIHDERVSVLVTVPRLIESLRDFVERTLESRGKLEKFRRDFEKYAHEHYLLRWWHFRKIRRTFGWRFLAMVSGGAALPAEPEKFWGRLGYAVIQGYGLTETTSLVSLNHPFRLGRGSIGKVLPGTNVKLSPEGEILVRGENIAAGYWKDGMIASLLDADGWFHTGDLGEFDANGNLYFKGRSKNVIVNAEGLNIYPADLEAELRKEPEVRDCVAFGFERDGNAEPCVALLLRDPEIDKSLASTIIARANARLAPFQQIRKWIVWRDADFPRTPTQKPLLAAIQAAAHTELKGAATSSQATADKVSVVSQLLARIAPHAKGSSAGAGKLQLSSIERVELMSALEDRFHVDMSETAFSNAETVADLERLVSQPSAQAPSFHYPRWAQSWPARVVRSIAFHLILRPIMFFLGRPRIHGRENLHDVNGPVIVVSNHVTYLDPAFVFVTLPPHLRKRLAVAMDGERLESMRTPPAGTNFLARIVSRVNYVLVILLFNVFPLPRLAGFRKSFEFAGELADRGWNILIFPEGVLTKDGSIASFRSGIGLLTTHLRLPVVPIRVSGLFEMKQENRVHAHAGEIQVSVGAPVNYADGQSPEGIAADLQRRVAAL